jgi:hypothetical protein
MIIPTVDDLVNMKLSSDGGVNRGDDDDDSSSDANTLCTPSPLMLTRASSAASFASASTAVDCASSTIESPDLAKKTVVDDELASLDLRTDATIGLFHLTDYASLHRRKVARTHRQFPLLPACANLTAEEAAEGPQSPDDLRTPAVAAVLNSYHFGARYRRLKYRDARENGEDTEDANVEDAAEDKVIKSSAAAKTGTWTRLGKSMRGLVHLRR